MASTKRQITKTSYTYKKTSTLKQGRVPSSRKSK